MSIKLEMLNNELNSLLKNISRVEKEIEQEKSNPTISPSDLRRNIKHVQSEEMKITKVIRSINTCVDSGLINAEVVASLIVEGQRLEKEQQTLRSKQQELTAELEKLDVNKKTLDIVYYTFF